MVRVTWLDPAFARMGWRAEDEWRQWCSEPDETVTSIGYVVAETDTHLVICQSRDEPNHTFAEGIKIARDMIRLIEPLMMKPAAE